MVLADFWLNFLMLQRWCSYNNCVLCLQYRVHKTTQNPSKRLCDKWLLPTVGWRRCSKCVQMHFWLTIFSAIGFVTATSFKSESVHVKTMLQHLLWIAFVTQAKQNKTKKWFWNSQPPHRLGDKGYPTQQVKKVVLERLSAKPGVEAREAETEERLSSWGQKRWRGLSQGF